MYSSKTISLNSTKQHASETVTKQCVMEEKQTLKTFFLLSNMYNGKMYAQYFYNIQYIVHY